MAIAPRVAFVLMPPLKIVFRMVVVSVAIAPRVAFVLMRPLKIVFRMVVVSVAIAPFVVFVLMPPLGIVFRLMRRRFQTVVAISPANLEIQLHHIATGIVA